MTPKEKAIDLVAIITETLFASGNKINKPMVKSAALIVANETKHAFKQFSGMHDQEFFDSEVEYWESVVNEIINL